MEATRLRDRTDPARVNEQMKMRRSDMWRELYRRERYLAHLSEEALRSRADSIANNSLKGTEDGKWALIGPDEGDFNWIQKYTEVDEEFALRGSRHRRSESDRWPIPMPPNLEVIRAVQQTPRPASEYLVHFLGQVDWAKALVEDGHIWMNPASHANKFGEDSSLRPAQIDDELNLTCEYPGEGGSLVGPRGERLPLAGRMEVKYQSRTDYYYYCMSRSLELRLFGDFGAAACVLIHNPREFIRRVVQGFLGTNPHWSWGAQNIRYIDPMRPEVKNISVFFGKDFGYAYQREFRLAFFPPSPRHDLDHVEFLIGSIEDIAELIVPTFQGGPGGLASDRG